MLACLARKPGSIVSADELLDAVWQGRPHADNTVYQAINHLRNAVGDDAHDPLYVETIPKRGYRLVCPVTAVEKDEEAHPQARRDLGLRVVGVLVLLVLVASVLTNIESTRVSSDAEQMTENDYYLLGRAYLHEENPTSLMQAIENFKRAIEANPGSAQAFAGLSESYSDLYWTLPEDDLLVKAKDAAEYALRLDDRLGSSHRAMGYVRHYAGDYEGAIESFGTAVTIDPNDIRSYAWLAASHEKKGDTEVAEEILLKALQDNPMSGQLNNRMALHILQNGDGDWNRAYAYFQRAMSRQPDYPYPYGEVAYYLYRMGQLEEAIHYASTAHELTVGSRRIDNSAYLLVSILIDIGDYALADKMLDEMKAIEAEYAGVTTLEIQLQIARQDLEQASTLAHRAISENLHDDSVVSLLATYEMLIGHIDHARQLYADLGAMPEGIQPGADTGLYQSSDLLWGALGAVNLAYLEKSAGESEATSSLISNALQFIESVKTDYPALEINGSVAYVLGQIAALNGDNDAAIDHLRQAVDDGWRQTWFARLDPIMAEAIKDRRFGKILGEVDASLAETRNRLGFSLAEN